MLKKEKIEISVSYRNVTHYLKLGYEAIINKTLEIYTKDLPIVSHEKIEAVCEICGQEKTIMYCKYIENKNRHGFYGCRNCSRQKAAMTSREIYGVNNYMMLEEAKEKATENNIRKYGVKTTLLDKNTKDKIAKTMIEKYGTDKFYEIRNGKGKRDKMVVLDLESKENDIIDPTEKYVPIHDKSYLDYRNEVRRLTRSSEKILFENWDGLDYYDNEDIRENFNLEHNDPRYPTIDHKISIYHGYTNKIDPNLIGSIENLCVTKRSINSSKRDQNFIP